MKICFICEGSYPYIAGGVSSWLHDLIQKLPEHEIIIWCIGSNESMKGQYKYKLPENVTEVHEAFLDSMLNKHRTSKKKVKFSEAEKAEVVKMLECENPNWDILFDAFASDRNDPMQFLLDPVFIECLKKVCEEKYPYLPFTDLFWTMRSMFLPVLYLIHGEMPEADIYHSVSCGYAGILAAAASRKYNKPYVLTEHGIYTREREEEILRSTWVVPQHKPIWISLFYMFSKCAYDHAHVVTSLFGAASKAQRELGCDADKQLVIPNGVNTDRFGPVPLKKENGFIDIGAIVRIVPIKDIKTMLYAFSRVCEERQDIRLHIMGPVDENPEYYDECMALKEELGLENAIFTGRIKTWEYLENVDFTLLTSISEGMPLATLEGMAAGRAAITTNVGSCAELIHGNGDNFGEAGYVVPAMNPKAMADAILKMASDPIGIRKMGDNGRARVFAIFQHPDMIKRYKESYDLAIARCPKEG